MNKSVNNDAANRAGRWIHVRGGFTPGGDPYYACSECNYGRCFGVEHPKPLERVCPFCGALLEGPEEGEVRNVNFCDR